MKERFRALALLMGMVFLSIVSKSQVDPHFSQYYIYPHYINPATTGLMEGDYRVSGIYRNQWSNISTPYSTAGVSADFNTNRRMNYGFNVLNQSAGNGGYNLLNGYANLAFTGLQFGNEGNQHVVLAMQAGFISRRFDPSKFELDDQWNPVTGYSPTHVTNDVFNSTSSFVFDMGAGALYYDGTNEKNVNPYFGIAAYHINKPTDPFALRGKGAIPMRMVVHGGLNVILSDYITMIPHFLYMHQGTAYEAMIGDFFQVSASDETDFLFGANYRHKDAVSPFAGITNNGFTIAATYDINISTLGQMAHGASSLEVTLSYMVKNPEKFNFKCPKL
jgi:type IX secretion system PorP/SprF family membrane protein